MIINIYLDQALNTVAIKGDLWGEYNPLMIPVGTSLDTSSPAVATKVRDLIYADKQDSPFNTTERQPAANIGGFLHETAETILQFNLWQLCEHHQGIVYLLECTIEPSDLKLDIASIRILEQVDIPSFGILQMDERWRTVYVSKTFSNMTGYSHRDISNRQWTKIIELEQAEPFLQQLYDNTRSDGSHECELRIQKLNGSCSWMSVHYKKVYDHFNTNNNIVLIFQDIDNSRRHQQQWKEMATTDLLTGLGNRYALQETLENRLRQLHPSGEFYLLYLDLDGFKAVNDAYGHSIGDKLLIDVAERISTLCSRGDFIARLGGDEFAIIRHKSSQPRIDLFAQELLEKIAQPYALVEFAEESYISSSIGIVNVSPANINYVRTLSDHEVKSLASNLLSQADEAMYDAKGAGRNTFCFYASQFEDRTRRNLILNDALHRSMERKDFALYYQPQWNQKENRLYGYEALIRWPSFSTMGPDQFIPIVENNGLMGNLGRWLFEQALRDHSMLLTRLENQRHHDDPPIIRPQLSVNFSPIQFRDRSLVDFIDTTLHKHQVPAETITIEITESLLITNYIEIEKQLNHLKRLGFKIALDDFGTGYSSLSNLHKFPIDIIKIDRSFIHDSKRFETQQITKAIIQLGKVLNKTIILEGVESNWQYDFCRAEDVELIQGWIISKALPIEKLEHFINRQEQICQSKNRIQEGVTPLCAA